MYTGVQLLPSQLPVALFAYACIVRACDQPRLRQPVTPSTADTRWSPALWATLIVLCGVVFLDALDVSMVGMALPSIQQDLNLSTDQLQWIVSGYVLGYGGLLLLGGRAADLLGRRRVLLWALAVFVIASALGGIASNGELLVAARFIKGASAVSTNAPAALDHHDDLRRRPFIQHDQSIAITPKTPVANKKIHLLGSCGYANALPVVEQYKVVPRSLAFRKFNFHLTIFLEIISKDFLIKFSTAAFPSAPNFFETRFATMALRERQL